MSTSRLPEFTDRFSKLRGDKSQAQFSDELGISRPTVALYENGQRIPDAVTLKTIAEKCNVSADYLIGLRDDPTTDKDVQFIVDYTGLSSDTINKFHEFAFLQRNNRDILDNFNSFILQFYARFLHRLFVLKDTVELTEEGLNAFLSDSSYGSINAEFAALKRALYDFSEFCMKIPEALFNSDKLYDELEKRSTAAFTASEEDIEQFFLQEFEGNKHDGTQDN